jgi:uncharacterized protein YqgC (DUF456 family)
MTAAAWALASLLILLGIAGSVLPALPGAPLILAAAVVHRLMLPGYVSMWSIVLLAVLSAVTILAEWAMSAVGARAFGGSKWSLIGAPVGALLGLPFGLFGILAGAVLGAAALEAAFAGRSAPDALKAGLGAGLGVVAGTFGRLAIALAMAAWLVADFLVN